MEVSPEVYAWLSALNIIEPFNVPNKNGMNSYFIPETILNSLFNGEYIDLMLLDLQKAYDKYYNIRKDCSPKLKELVFKEKNFDNISEKTRLNNWNIINDALKIFDEKIQKIELDRVVSKNNNALLKIMSNIFNVISRYLKYSKRDTNKDNKSIINKTKNIRDNSKLNLNLNFSNQKISNSKNISNVNNINSKTIEIENNTKLLNKSQSEILKNINKNYSDSSFNNNINSLNNLISNESNNINENIMNDINKNDINSNDANIILNEKRPLIEYLDVEKLSENILYENCSSTLEFFIVSLCKNFQLKPTQAIGLLSNNRQYLSVLCRSGINGNYIVIKKWLEDLQINYDILLKLIFKYEDGVYMTYCIIGTALCSKNYDISLYAVDLLRQLYKNVGLNNDWFIKIGINSFFFVFIKHSDKLLYFLNIMVELIEKDDSIFFNEIKNKIINDDEYKTLIFDILPNIISVSKKLDNKNFFNNFKNFVFSLCIHEEKKLTYSCSILCDCFYYYYQMIDNDLINNIILFFKKCLRSKNSNIYGSTIAKIFVLIDNLGRVYNQYAPSLYKFLISIFMEMYDDLQRREIFLINFQTFLIEHKQIPLDIFLEPYMDRLKNCENYNLCDFYFLFKILEHPRIEYNDLINIINFLLSISLNHILYNKCICFILEKILIDFIPKAKFDDIQLDELSILFIDYINQILEIYIMNQNNISNGNIIENNENEYDQNEILLEVAYIIIKNTFGEVNNCLKIKLIECDKIFYDNNKRHSGILLGMLKTYEDFGNILFEIEQV